MVVAKLAGVGVARFGCKTVSVAGVPTYFEPGSSVPGITAGEAAKATAAEGACGREGEAVGGGCGTAAAGDAKVDVRAGAGCPT